MICRSRQESDAAPPASGHGSDAAEVVALHARVSGFWGTLLEQPVARGREADLEGFFSPIPIAADESALSLVDVASLVGRFNVINIKLDKCGGLTEALAMSLEARRLGLGVMVGNMVGSSLAMAPGYVVDQRCDVVDLDGPIFLSRDRQPGVTYADGMIRCDSEVWGSGYNPAG